MSPNLLRVYGFGHSNNDGQVFNLANVDSSSQEDKEGQELEKAKDPDQTCQDLKEGWERILWLVEHLLNGLQATVGNS